MKKIKSAFKNSDGNGYPLVLAVILVLMLIVSGIIEMYRLQITAQGVRDAVQSAVIAVVNDNYSNVYHGVREGYSGGYKPSNEIFVEAISAGDVFARLDNVLNLTDEGEYHTKITAQGETEFKLSKLSVAITNAPQAAPDNAQARFSAECFITLEVPVFFAGELLPPMRIKMKIAAGYIPKFG